MNRVVAAYSAIMAMLGIGAPPRPSRGIYEGGKPRRSGYNPSKMSKAVEKRRRLNYISDVDRVNII
jgi:hypothetical protein